MYPRRDVFSVPHIIFSHRGTNTVRTCSRKAATSLHAVIGTSLLHISNRDKVLITKIFSHLCTDFDQFIPDFLEAFFIAMIKIRVSLYSSLRTSRSSCSKYFCTPYRFNVFPSNGIAAVAIIFHIPCTVLTPAASVGCFPHRMSFSADPSVQNTVFHIRFQYRRGILIPSGHHS